MSSIKVFYVTAVGAGAAPSSDAASVLDAALAAAHGGAPQRPPRARTELAKFFDREAAEKHAATIGPTGGIPS